MMLANARLNPRPSNEGYEKSVDAGQRPQLQAEWAIKDAETYPHGVAVGTFPQRPFAVMARLAAIVEVAAEYGIHSDPQLMVRAVMTGTDGTRVTGPWHVPAAEREVQR